MATLEYVLEEAVRNNRVCPLPPKWQALHRMLANRAAANSIPSPSFPLILSAWWHTSDVEKAMRFRQHIEWAASHGCLDKVAVYIATLPECEWLHTND